MGCSLTNRPELNKSVVFIFTTLVAETEPRQQCTALGEIDERTPLKLNTNHTTRGALLFFSFSGNRLVPLGSGLVEQQSRCVSRRHDDCQAGEVALSTLLAGVSSFFV